MVLTFLPLEAITAFNLFIHLLFHMTQPITGTIQRVIA